MPLNHRTVYVPPGSKSSTLTRRLPRRLKVGETRPPIYYKFSCTVEMSDGSTITRRSQFPKTEWRYLADQRNNPKWNPTRTNLVEIESDATGKLARFKQRYGFTDITEPEESQTEKKEGTEKQENNMNDMFAELMGQNVAAVQSGGKVAAKRRKK